jgi:hypothetical protein
MGDGGDRIALDVARLEAWLCGPQVVDADGRVWSWHAEGSSGYPYPEAGGLWLSWAARALPRDDPRARAVASWLAHELDADRIGRDGISHAFDLGVVLRGAIEWSETPSAAMRCGARRLCSAIAEHRAAWGNVEIPDRWSTRFGEHHLKLLFALAAIERADLCPVERARARLHDVLDRTDYLHARLYALEGRALAGDDIDDALAELVAVQLPNGGLPAWSSSRGPTRSDATAQAVRLWAWRDPMRFADPIRRALAFLARLAGDGVRYDDACDHRNTWCTLFALQATRFAAGTASLADLL